MTLVKYRPNSTYRFNRTWNHLLDDFFQKDLGTFLGSDHQNFVPSVNVIEAENGYRIELAAPGFSKDAFNLDVHQKQLTISAEVKDEQLDEKEKFTRREFRKSSFSRSFNLPENVNSEKISASFNNGILNIELPLKKEEKKKNRVIEIK
ncbi:MAG: Hsp20/alpha crystallin family protein [Salibacteraceae bacterium]